MAVQPKRISLFLIRHISCLDKHARASTSQMLDVGAIAKVTATRFHRLDEYHDQTRRIIDCLQEDATTARAGVRELIDRHAIMDQKVIEAERRVPSRGGQRGSKGDASINSHTSRAARCHLA